MTTYTCGALRPIRNARNAREAAMIFARRIAKQTYGRSADCHHVRRDLVWTDGTSANYEAFIGLPPRRTGDMWSGKNVFMTITANPKHTPGSIGDWDLGAGQ